jgi:hypothetical protein
MAAKGESRTRTSAMICGGIAVGVLTTLSCLINSNLFFYLLFPRNATSLLITGGHGGTQVQDGVAFLLGFAINLMLYSFLIFAVLHMRNGRRQKAEGIESNY